MAAVVVALAVAGCGDGGPAASTEAPLPTQVEQATHAAPQAEQEGAGARVAVPRGTRGNPLAWVGEKHNEGLHFILSGIPAEVRARGSRAEYFAAAFGRCVAYMAREHLATSACDRLTRPGAASAWRRSRGGWTFAGGARRSGLPGAHGAPLLAVQSSDLNGYLAAIETESGAYGTLGDLDSSLGTVENSAKAVLAPEEMEIVLAVSAVAYSSADYWETNSDTWLSDNGLVEDVLLMNRRMAPSWRPSNHLALAVLFSESTVQRSWSHRRVVRADVGGAIAGAIGGFLAGGHVLDGAIAGAITFSAAEAITQLLELLE